MNLIESLLGYRSFSSELEIREAVKTSRSHDSSSESSDDASSLLIFETSRQHTWLVATSERVYFILDDVRKPAPQIKRAVRRGDLQVGPDGRIAVDTQSRSTSTGLVDIGLRRRGWLYSKDLFSSRRPIEHAIDELLGAAEGPASAGDSRAGAAAARA